MFSKWERWWLPIYVTKEKESQCSVQGFALPRFMIWLSPQSTSCICILQGEEKKSKHAFVYKSLKRWGCSHFKKNLTTTKSTPNVIDSLCTCLCIFSRLCIYKWEMYDSSFEVSIITRYFFLRLNMIQIWDFDFDWTIFFIRLLQSFL